MFNKDTIKEVKENLSKIKDISSSTIIMEEIYKILKVENGKKRKKK